MVALRGPDHRDIDEQAAAFIHDATAAVKSTLRKAADRLHGFVTPDDLATTDQLWAEHLDDLLPHVTAAYAAGIEHTHRAQYDAVVKILADRGRPIPLLASADDPAYVIPKISNPLATEQLANARNRLVAVGDDVWHAARGQLVEGLKAGEGIALLKDRVINSADFSSYRAQLVARSETSHAMNQGSLAQMRSLDLPTVKEWIAIDDGRTRPEHAEVNGEKVGIDDQFSIGEDPGDAPNCRCTLGYEITDAAGDTGTEQSDDALVDTVCPDCKNQQTFLTNPNDIAERGARARYAIEGGGKKITAAGLKRAGIVDKEMQQRILKMNDAMQQRYGKWFATVEDTMKYYGVTDVNRGKNVIAYVRNGKILGVNQKLLQDNAIARDEATGWLARGTGKIEDTLVHEYGHFLLQTGPRSGSFGRRVSALRKAGEAARKAGMPLANPATATPWDVGLVSRYAATKNSEAVAELWSHYNMGGSLRPPWVIKWGETLMNELGLDPTPLCVDLGVCP